MKPLALPAGLLVLLLGLSLSLATPGLRAADPFPGVASAAEMEQAKREAINAMEPWLQKEDVQDDATAWDMASARFKATVTREAWIEGAKSVHATYGPCTSRRIVSTLYSRGVPSAGVTNGAQNPKVTATFRSTFRNAGAAIETVVFTRDDDGQWRALSYAVKPAS